MRQKKSDCIVLAVLAVAAVIMLSAAWSISYKLGIYGPKLYDSEYISLVSGWYDENGKIDKLTEYKYDKSAVLYYDIINDSFDGKALFLSSKGSAVRISLDGEVLYSYAMELRWPDKLALGENTCIAKFPQECMGKTIKLELVSYYDNLSVPIIVLSDEENIVAGLFAEYSASFFMAFVIVLLAAMILLIYAVAKLKKIMISGKAILYLALFMILSAVWVITDSKICQLYFSNTIFIAHISFMSFYMFPVAFLLFFKEMYKDYEKKTNIFIYMFIISIAAIVAMYIFNIYSIMQSIWIIHLNIILAMVYIITVMVRQVMKKSEKISKIMLAGIGVLCVFSLLDIVRFYFHQYDRVFVKNSVGFNIGFIFMILMLIFATIEYYAGVIRNNIRSSVYKKMAYTDSMTRIGNRNAFKRYLIKMAEESAGVFSVGIAVLDLNNLKTVNDTFGHASGDLLIKGMADILRQITDIKTVLFRIGGDEFVCIMPDVSACYNAEEAIRRNIEIYNKTSEFKISAAIGYAYRDISGEDIHEKLVNVFKEADDKMYEDKRKFHEKNEC